MMRRASCGLSMPISGLDDFARVTLSCMDLARYRGMAGEASMEAPVPPLCPTTLSHHRSHHSKGARARPPEARRCWGPSAPRPRAAAGPLARHGPQSTPLFNEARHLGGSLTRLQVGEHERPLAAHALGILLHHLERGAHVGSKIGLV